MFKFGGKKGIWELISVVGSRHNALSLKSIMHVYAGVWLWYGKKDKNSRVLFSVCHVTPGTLFPLGPTKNMVCSL